MIFVQVCWYRFLRSLSHALILETALAKEAADRAFIAGFKPCAVDILETKIRLNIFSPIQFQLSQTSD